VSLAEGILALLLVGLAAYVVLAGADFGAGLWELVSGAGPGGARMRWAIHRSVGPVWEANHVWLIFALVVLWTGFPQAFGSIMSTLAIPLFLAAVGIIFRGSAFAFQPHVGEGRAGRLTSVLFGVSSVLTPFVMGAAIGGIASGRVPVGNAAGDPWTSWLNPTSVFVGTLAVAVGAHLAAVYLAADTRTAGDVDLAEAFRRRALISGAVAGSLAIGGLLIVRADAEPLWDGLTGDALPLVAVSGVAGIATLGLVVVRRFGPARLGAAAAVGAVVIGWGVAQRPDILPGALTIDRAAASRPTLVAVLVGVGIGALVLVPSLVWLFRLFLRGELSHEGEGDAS
jgi:cytochrome d ubiquinol oxidase subunit II